MSQPHCVLCTYYHPRAEPHPAAGLTRQTCDAGLRRLEHELLSIKAAFRRLAEEVCAEPGARDLVSQLLPGAPTPSPSNQPRVTGSKERQLPVDVNRVDLLLPVRDGYVQDPYRDQGGRLSAASILNEWVAEWHDRWYHAQSYPRTDAPSLIDWVLGVRLIYVAEHEEAIADFADEMHDLRQVLRAALGDTKPPRARMWGVACPRCEIVSQLTLDPEDPDRYRECDNCGVMLTNAEYLAHLRKRVEEYQQRTPLAGR